MHFSTSGLASGMIFVLLCHEHYPPIEPGIVGCTFTAAAAKVFGNIASHIQSLNNAELVDVFAQSLALGRTISGPARFMRIFRTCHGKWAASFRRQRINRPARRLVTAPGRLGHRQGAPLASGCLRNRGTAMAAKVTDRLWSLEELVERT
jgi:hypothetical protein